MDFFLDGLVMLFTVKNFLFMNIGIFVGIIFGATPGLTANLGIILLLPMTFSMEATNSILMLLGIYCGGTYGGSISAILLGTPGTNVAAATLLDGYPLAQKGHAQKALDIALIASTIGGLFSALLLLFAAPAISKFTIKFAGPEYFSLAIFGLSIIAGVSGKSLSKGIISGCLGFLISTIGMDQNSGVLRFTFGNLNLMRGLGILPVLLGVFAIPIILEKILDNSYTEEYQSSIKLKSEDHLSREEIKRCLPHIFKSSLIGSFIGAIPGAGAAIAAYICYNEARRSSKNPELFGKGAVEGVAAPEAGNNAVTGSSLIPLFTLGIPGSVVAATLIGALTMQGLVPGPELFRSQGVTIYAIMSGLVFVNIFMFFQGKVLTKYFSKITKVPQILLIPVLVLFCVAGSFAFSNSIFNVFVFIFFGMLCYLMSKLGFPAVPIVLGMILGPIAEINLQRALVMSEGSLLIFIQRPISLFFIIITFGFLIIIKHQNKKLSK
jgi:putative tricarboxylic transport membrane protein